MKPFIITIVAVLVGIWAYSKLRAGKAQLVAYQDPATGKTVFVDPSTVYTVNEHAVFAGPDVDPLTGAHTAPGSQPGTVGFSAQEN